MAKTNQTAAGSSGTGEGNKEPEKGDEMGKSGDAVEKAPTRPATGPTTNDDSRALPPPGELDQPTRKPRQSQPLELAQLVNSKETMERIMKSLPRHLTPERWISVLLNVNSGDSKLQKCDPRTIVRAALQGAVLGLDFNKTLREAYLIPRSHEKPGPDGKPLRDQQGRIITFWEATFMPGYAGLRKLVMNGGEVVNVRSSLVYESEVAGTHGEFVYLYDPDLRFLHRPCLNPRERGDIVLAYSVAKLKTGEYSIEVMTLDEVEKSGHQRSQLWISSRGVGRVETGPWVDDYEMMVRKTVLKRHCNQLPMSADLAQAIDLDNLGYVSSLDRAGQPQGRRAIEAAKRGRGSETLAERLGGLYTAAEEDPENHGHEPIDGDASVDDTGADAPA